MGRVATFVQTTAFWMGNMDPIRTTASLGSPEFWGCESERTPDLVERAGRGGGFCGCRFYAAVVRSNKQTTAINYCPVSFNPCREQRECGINCPHSEIHL